MVRALLVAALLLPAAARAQPSAALRAGWAFALGDLARHVPVSDGAWEQFPLQLDLLWRFGPASAGAYASWGPGAGGADVCAGASCSASVVRVGAQGLWAFDPLGDARVVPWGGVALGWEWASLRRERLGSAVAWTWSGPEVALQGGAEWPIGDRFAVGPALRVGFGRYAREALDTSAASASAPVDARAFHAWIDLGVRGRFDF